MLCALFAVLVIQQAPPQEDVGPTFRPLFPTDGLDSWHNVNGVPDTWTVKDGELICTGKPSCFLRSDRQYENFILELDWMQPKADSTAGLLIWADALPAIGQPRPRGIEVQIRAAPDAASEIAFGDVSSSAGAHMTPDRPHPKGEERCLASEQRLKPAGEWNHYRIVARDGTLKLEVNDKEVSGGYNMTPRKGYLCFESAGSEVHFKEMRIAELPGSKTPPKPEQIADRDHGFRALYDGVDLAGFKQGAREPGHWQPNDWRLLNDGSGETLTTEATYQDFELLLDWDWEGEAPDQKLPLVLVRGATAPTRDFAGDVVTKGWNRLLIKMESDRCTMELNGHVVLDRVGLPNVASKGPIGIRPSGAKMQLANLFVR